MEYVTSIPQEVGAQSQRSAKGCRDDEHVNARKPGDRGRGISPEHWCSHSCSCSWEVV